MKMRDVWGWDNIPQNYGTYDSAEANGVYHSGEYYGFLFNNTEPAKAVAHAVKYHDVLVDALDNALDMLSYTGHPETFSKNDKEDYYRYRALLEEVSGNHD